MSWSGVGKWLSKNAGGLLGLAGSVATGNIPGGVAAVASMIGEATGETDPAKALSVLQGDPVSMIRLEEIAKRNEQDIRKHHRDMLELQLKDEQSAHTTQQDTIKEGDRATDEYVRRTRPRMARQSWWGGVIYIAIMEILKAFGKGTGADAYLAGTILAPALAYMGFRTLDKIKGTSLSLSGKG